jgi:hypothetical protein
MKVFQTAEVEISFTRHAFLWSLDKMQHAWYMWAAAELETKYRGGQLTKATKKANRVKRWAFEAKKKQKTSFQRETSSGEN